MAQLFGKYRATVMNNVDPMAMGRLLLQVPDVVAISSWAAACIPPVPRSLVQVPAVGSGVWVEFEGGDADYPVWTGVMWDLVANTADVDIESAGRVTITATELVVTSPTAVLSGVLTAETLVANTVTAASYTPGVGNIW